MRLQKVTLVYPGDIDSVYIDIDGTEEASDSFFLLTEHKMEGFQGLLSYGWFVENSSERK